MINLSRIKYMMAEGESFGIVSAEKARLTPAENLLRTAGLIKVMMDAKADIALLAGVYGGKAEASILIRCTTAEQMIALGAAWEQETIIFSNGGTTRLMDCHTWEDVMTFSALVDGPHPDGCSKIVETGEEFHFI